ncbi:unnamed protein product [Parascedosporium putredinis]|uniref:Uncharacterized protein n=1 Tax=Parascedosporium putredinis TaxID=1442378 RepID=A0A9P1GZ52_9PEZI|nr:unnamed protein product [Parascedosporium putredinis]CAI7992487.1 unnamed protein product [Parascedosporium putredinis]
MGNPSANKGAVREDEASPPSPVVESVTAAPTSKRDNAVEPNYDSDANREDPEDAKHLDGDAAVVRGAVVIRDGNDIARYVVSTRDDHDPVLTFRSFIIGSGLTALAACINQIYYYKPVEVSFASVFLCLLAYVLGVAWSKALLVATTGNGAAIVQVFGAERLFYNRETAPATAILTIFSASIFGYGLVGILRSIIVHPSEMVWWQCLPMISIYQTFHREPEGANRDRLRMFGLTSIAMFIWEPFASYIWPWMNGISIPCLASMKALPPTRGILMTIFGGISSNEGQGLFNFSLDWQYITSRYMSLPLLQQANSWAGIVYNQTAIFGKTAILDTDALAAHGLPRLTATNVWANMAAMAAIGALITHISLFYGSQIKKSLTQAWKKEQTDPHYKIMAENYKDVPIWWYVIILFVGFFLGLGAIYAGNTTLDPWAYVPGKPIANLYFSMFSHEVTVLSVFLATDLKMAQYLKIPWRTMFLLQTYGSLLGTALNYVIMDNITTNRREVLLDPIGTQVWSGQKIQSLNTNAVTWSLAKYVYGFGKDGYGWIPLSILIGAAIPVLHWLVAKRHTKILGWDVRKLVAPVIFTTRLLLAPWYMRLRHPAWFGKYNYIVGGGLDAGAKVMMFILTFAVFGGSGDEVPFPTWWGNPKSSKQQYADYCGTGIPVAS